MPKNSLYLQNPTTIQNWKITLQLSFSSLKRVSNAFKREKSLTIIKSRGSNEWQKPTETQRERERERD